MSVNTVAHGDILMKLKNNKAAMTVIPAAVLCAGLLSSAPVLADDAELGRTIYEEACAICHGDAGKGDGEFAQHLNVRPSDLTMLASRQSDGKFPYLDVFMSVDGRTTVAGHGSRDMPIWGNVFSRQVGDYAGPYGAELLIRAQLVALVDYLQSLQAQ